jgi:hypothetical protein
MAERGNAKLTDLLVTLADCEKARSVSIHDLCKVRYGGGHRGPRRCKYRVTRALLFHASNRARNSGRDSPRP